MIRKILLLVALILVVHNAQAAFVNVQGWVFYPDGTPVPTGTPVNLTQLTTSWQGNTTTDGASNNYYIFFGVTAADSGLDEFYVYSWKTPYNGSNQGPGLGTVTLNITFPSMTPSWNSSLPNQLMEEDNTTGIDNAFNLSNYIEDYENDSLTFSISSQSNPALVLASIDGDYLDIAAPAVNQSGSNNVCVRGNDGTSFSQTACFTITVNSNPDPPTFSAAADNVTTILSGGTTMRVTTTASDVDGDQVTLYVCDNPTVNAAGCIGTERCRATAASNPQCAFAAPSDTASHTWYAFIYDATGIKAPQNYSENYETDSSNPSPGTVSAESGDDFVTSTSVDLAWAGFTDTGSGIAYYYYSWTDNSGSQVGTQTALTTGTLTGASQGNNTVYVWAEDNVGNIGNDARDWIWVDSEVPVVNNFVESPSSIVDTYSGSYTAQVRITDTTWNGSAFFRYRWNSGSWTSWTLMTDLGSNNYQLAISETWSTHTGDVLNYEISAIDYLGNTNTTLRSKTINVFNTGPSLVPIGNKNGLEGENLSFVISATDAEGGTLIFTSDYNFSFGRIDDDEVIAWWVPTDEDLGNNLVTFTVDDGYETDSETITISVTPTNDAPVLNPIGNLEAYLHKPFLHYISGWDPDNQNTEITDNDLLIFDKEENLRWFRIYSYFNASNASYYGVINFTPLLSHRGRHNITIYVSDGTLTDSENISFIVGYCGDTDAGGEPWCDEDYESCITCPTDCGKCSSDEDEFMTIIIDPRNCLNRNFTIWTYQLYERATCDVEGKIVQGMEVCGNLSSVKLDIFQLKNGKWEKVDEYITDDNGEITFVPTDVGEYKITAEKSGYPKAFEYLEIHPCFGDEEEETVETKVNKTVIIPPEEEEPTEIPPETEEPGEIIEEGSTFSIILWYVIVPTLIIILIVLSYYYYDKNKNNVVWILKARIWFRQNYIKYSKMLKKQWNKLLGK